MENQEIQKKTNRWRFRWLVWLLASPFILFVLLCVLLYLPPVQKFVVDKVTSIASESTGLNISVGRINLSFPLDLIVRDVQAINPEKGDTLLDLKRLDVSIQMLPLIRKEVEIDGVSLKGAEIHTDDFIEGIIIDGSLGELFLESHNVVFDPGKAVLNEFLLKDADFYVCLNDTTETRDTTTNDTLYWKFDIRKIVLDNVKLKLDMPRDSLSLMASLEKSEMRGGYIDLHEESYALQSFSIDEGAFMAEKMLDVRGIDCQMDSLYYNGRNIRAIVSRFDFHEQMSGFDLLSTYAKVLSDQQQICIPQFNMKTASSAITMNASADWNIFEMNPSAAISLSLNAGLGKRDIAIMTGTLLDSTFIRHYPDAPLQIKTDMSGRLNRMNIRKLSATLSDALDVQVKGEFVHLMDSIRRKGNLDLLAKANDLTFLPTMTGGYAVPEGTRLHGNVHLDGSNVDVQMALSNVDTLMVIDTLVTFEAKYNIQNDAYLWQVRFFRKPLK